MEDQVLFSSTQPPRALSPSPMEEVESRSTTTTAQGETDRECTDTCPEMTSEGLPGPSLPRKATSNELGEIECPCCLDLEKAHQPMDLKFSLRGSRCIQSGWYSVHHWIMVCSVQNAIYCQACRLAKQRGLITSANSLYAMRTSSFIQGGFCNWKKALQKLAEHGKIDLHREAALKIASLKDKRVDIAGQISVQCNREQELN